MARPAGLEPATPGLEGRCSIQLSYGRSGVIVRDGRPALVHGDPRRRRPATDTGPRGHPRTSGCIRKSAAVRDSIGAPRIPARSTPMRYDRRTALVAFSALALLLVAITGRWPVLAQ